MTTIQSMSKMNIHVLCLYSVMPIAKLAYRSFLLPLSIHVVIVSKLVEFILKLFICRIQNNRTDKLFLNYLSILHQVGIIHLTASYRN